MYYEIYLDVVFIINFILDFVIIKITGCIAKRKATLLRCIAAAIAGSCVLCLVYIFFIELLVQYYFVMMLIINTITISMVFCRKKSKLHEIVWLLIVYYAVSFIMGGLINLVCVNIVADTEMFTVPWWCVVFIGMAGCLIVRPLMLLKEKRKEKESIYFNVELSMNGKNTVLNGMLDTGNHLIEPVSGKPVRVAELSAVEGMLTKEFINAVKRYYKDNIIETGLYLGNGIRMVPFRAVGTPEEKLLIAVVADVIEIRNEVAEYVYKNAYIALYDGKLALDGSYQILLNSKELIKERG